MRKLIACLLVALPLAILFSSSEGNHHHRLEEEIDLIEKAEATIKSLKIEVADYLSYRKKLKKDNEVLLKEIGEWDIIEKEDERFQKAMTELEHDFLTFRESLGRFVAEIDSDSSHARMMQAMSILNATEWYVDYMKKVAFPERWKQNEKNR